MAARRLSFSPNAAEALKHLPPEIKRGVKAAFRGLSAGSVAGEALQRELAGLWKYPVRRYRIVYELDKPGRTIRILAIGHRRVVYDELAELARGTK